MHAPSNKLIILDRDGVINHDSDDYIKSADEWLPINGSATAIARLNQAGYKVAVATNQSGVGRGYYDLATLAAIHQKMLAHLADYHAHIDCLVFCPHTPNDNCDCRKPKAGLLDQICTQLGSPLEGALMVGDSLRDLEAGLARNCIPVLVKTGKGQRYLDQGLPKHLVDVSVAKDLAAVADHIIKLHC